MSFDRLTNAGVTENVARAHAEALSEALHDTVATKDDLKEMSTDVKQRTGDLEKAVEISALKLTVRGAGALTVIVTLVIGLKYFG